MEYRRDEHAGAASGSVHLVVYHLVWTPKRRKAVLRGQIARDFRDLVERKCAEQRWEILELAVQPDHEEGCSQSPITHHPSLRQERFW